MILAVSCFVGVCVFRVIYVYTYFACFPTYENLMVIYPVSWVVTIFLIVGAYVKIVKKLEQRFAANKLAM